MTIEFSGPVFLIRNFGFGGGIPDSLRLHYLPDTKLCSPSPSFGWFVADPWARAEDTDWRPAEGSAALRPPASGQTLRPGAEGSAALSPPASGQALRTRAEGSADLEPPAAGQALRPRAEGSADLEPPAAGQALRPRAEGSAALRPTAEGSAALRPPAAGQALRTRAEGSADLEPPAAGQALRPRAAGSAALRPTAEGSAALRPPAAGLAHPTAHGAPTFVRARQTPVTSSDLALLHRCHKTEAKCYTQSHLLSTRVHRQAAEDTDVEPQTHIRRTQRREQTTFSLVLRTPTNRKIYIRKSFFVFT
ncbi:hypothetical protein NDU88_003141 [Pleurodeles waltl]|uniref:Uncharacterized protein n=1 Tax=Pleurodeles waltl TaxID=8319 RepID=A0AAV7LEG5_PLEWA|nr:hypothetical protein NDU88_003141 [Pleurodeles waltl]